jgi:hypothetical protein
MFERFVRWFSRTKFWIWFVKNIMAQFTFRFDDYTSFPLHEYWNIVSAIASSEGQAGGPWRSLYAFTSTDYESFGSKLIRGLLNGRVSHAGIILPGASAPLFKIFHMTSKGCLYEPLIDLLKEVDLFTVSRFNIPEDKAVLLEKRMQFLIANKDMLAYDFQGELESTIKWADIDSRLMRGEIPRLKEKVNLYCSETIRLLLEGIVDLPFCVEQGRPAFSPDDTRAHAHAEIFTREPEIKKHSTLRWILTILVLPILLVASLLP